MHIKKHQLQDLLALQLMFFILGVDLFRSCRGGTASNYCRFWCTLAAVRMFRISMARVMGPTPPGTGVI